MTAKVNMGKLSLAGVILALCLFLSVRSQNPDYMVSCNNRPGTIFEFGTDVHLKCSFRLSVEEVRAKKFVLIKTQFDSIDCSSMLASQPSHRNEKKASRFQTLKDVKERLEESDVYPEGCEVIDHSSNDVDVSITQLDPDFTQLEFEFEFDSRSSGKYFLLEQDTSMAKISEWELPSDLVFLEGKVNIPGRVIQDSSATIQCNVLGYPISEIIWSRENVPIVNSNEHIKLASTGSLVHNNLEFDKSRVEDSAVYSCKVVSTSTDVIISRETKFYVSRHLNVLWPILGILAQALVIFLIIALSKGTTAGNPTKSGKNKILIERSMRKYKKSSKLITMESDIDASDM